MKIHCIIQARLGSTRLPGKVLKEIGQHQDGFLIDYVYDRCSLARNVSEVIIARHGFEHECRDIVSVDGPEEPAARFVKVLAEYPCDGFVRVCADSPFIDGQAVDGAALAVADGVDYLIAGNGIHGNQAEGFNTKAFLNAEPSMQGDEREHLGLWFQRRDRLTVDTPGDLERARLIVSRMTKPHTEYTAAECLELLRNG